jgi:chromosome segregation ATPase
MGQSDALQRATERLDAAADQLEILLSGVFADAEGGGSIAELKDQVHLLSQERERLLADLDAERNRVRRLKAANEEVSGRLEAVMVTLKDLMPAVPG